MDDETTTQDPATTAAAAAAPAPETLGQEIEDEAVTLYDDAKVELEKVAALFSADVWPYIKAGFMQLLTVAGKAAMQAEVAAIPLELAGQETAAAAAVGAAITSAVVTNAAAVAKTEGKAALSTIAADPNATDGEKALAAEGETLVPVAQASTGAAS